MTLPVIIPKYPMPVHIPQPPEPEPEPLYCTVPCKRDCENCEGYNEERELLDGEKYIVCEGCQHPPCEECEYFRPEKEATPR